MILAMGADHAGARLRDVLARWAVEHHLRVTRWGALEEEAYDYPEAADQVVAEVLGGRADRGVLICGTGLGMCIRANRYPGIRAILGASPEHARLGRLHNHANVLCLGARTTSPDAAVAILETFLSTAEDPDERHQRRVLQLDRNVDLDCGVG